MNSQMFIRICMAFIRPYFFSPTNHIIFGDFAMNFKFSYSQGYLPGCESSINMGTLLFFFLRQMPVFVSKGDAV